ncbi:hypothetical protein PGT21_018571 [Puccinia graminis f. sp. tritici]|uniref:Uncharacterized protein n=1 Tax=Puccinia graminis f. sp. tritici TaxID=56615 RepID=A0A5B0LUR1_PUCGR|nr:hypothetical protein PGT21_018571 [Puccinia graminis f. sp. tritici]KAA1093405.1 hypothetical protein PGTUg99_009155 [Puccinia graminis f. sp. tritici]
MDQLTKPCACAKLCISTLLLIGYALIGIQETFGSEFSQETGLLQKRSNRIPPMLGNIAWQYAILPRMGEM